jgi:hypothetical protein
VPFEQAKILDHFNRREGALDAQVAEAETTLGKRLPVEYIEFLRFSNGGEGFVGEHYLILWGAEELGPSNRDCEVEEYAPGLLMFGSDGGGEAFGFDTRVSDWPVVVVPFIGSGWEDALPLVDSFGGFFQRLHENESLFSSPGA